MSNKFEYDDLEWKLFRRGSMNIPNFLTLLRIILIPILVLIFYLPFKGHHLVAASIFLLAAITDWLDGFLARSLKQTSKLGAFLDPVADKLIVAVALMLLVSEFPYAYFSIPAAIIVGREIVVSALREWMAEVGKRANVAVSFIAKIKTTLQMIAVFILLAYTPDSFLWVGIIGFSLIYLAAILTLWSMVMYLNAAWGDLTFNEKTR